MNDIFEEDDEPSWRVKQREDALAAEQAFERNEKHVYVSGQQVGNFLFVRYNRYKNRATFSCQECGRCFSYNIYNIKNKKRCKWHKFHFFTL